MARRVAWICTALALACHPTAPAAPTQEHSAAERPDANTVEPPLKLVEVAPGIYAALQPAQRRFRDSNAAVVLVGDEVIVVDGPQRLVATEWLADRFRLGDSDRSVRLVTTHWHLDHSLAATYVHAMRAGGAPVLEHIGHADLAPLLAADGAKQLAEHHELLADTVKRATQMLDSGDGVDGPLTASEIADVEDFLVGGRAELAALDRTSSLAPPTREISEPTTMTWGTAAVEFVPLRAHTDADLVLYLPETRIVIGGDVVDGLPFAGHGHPYRWRQALVELRKRPIDTIIPGHGPLLGPEHIDRMIALFTAILEQACEATERNQGAKWRYADWQKTEAFEEVQQGWVTDDVSERAFNQFVPGAIARAMEQGEGCP